MTRPEMPDGAGDQASIPAGTPPADPWKSFRGVMAATLILEAIVMLLAIPVVGAVGGGLTAESLSYLIGTAVLLILLAGLQGSGYAFSGRKCACGSGDKQRGIDSIDIDVDRFAIGKAGASDAKRRVWRQRCQG